jgi:hypothetical protein
MKGTFVSARTSPDLLQKQATNIDPRSDFHGRWHWPNWLPAPKGDFVLMMRMYWPKDTRLGPQNPLPNWSDPVLLAALERAFDSTWPVIRAHEAGNDKTGMAELSMALVKLAADGVTDPQELRRLALETFPLAIFPAAQTKLRRPRTT